MNKFWRAEDPLNTAFRELEEETGYQAHTMTPLFQFYSSPGFCNEMLYVFVAKNLTLTKQKLDPTEKITILPTSFDNALKQIEEGEIEDGKTIATLLYVATVGTSQ